MAQAQQILLPLVSGQIPVQFSGTPGQDGLSSATTVELFQLTNSTSAPADPTGDLTYTFSNGVTIRIKL